MGVDILTTPLFDHPLFSPDVINLFENLRGGGQTFLDISQSKIF